MCECLAISLNKPELRIKSTSSQIICNPLTVLFVTRLNWKMSKERGLWLCILSLTDLYVRENEDYHSLTEPVAYPIMSDLPCLKHWAENRRGVKTECLFINAI